MGGAEGVVFGGAVFISGAAPAGAGSTAGPGPTGGATGGVAAVSAEPFVCSPSGAGGRAGCVPGGCPVAGRLVTGSEYGQVRPAMMVPPQVTDGSSARA